MRFLIASVLISVALGSVAATPKVGLPIPELEIRDKGELVIVNKDIRYQTWSTEDLNGHWTLLQYMAARPRASKVNRHVIDAISLKQNAGVAVTTVNIINVADVPFGATGFALGELRANKEKYPDSTLIGDMETGRIHWELKPRASSIFLIDPEGTVRYFKDGTLSGDELQQLLETLPEPDKPSQNRPQLSQ